MPPSSGNYAHSNRSPADTPTDRGINQIIREINSKCGLHIPERRHADSPSRRPLSPRLIVEPQLKFLYHRDRELLHRTLGEFLGHVQTPHGQRYESQDKLQLLRDMLTDAVKLAPARPKLLDRQLFHAREPSEVRASSPAASDSSEDDRKDFFTAPDSPTLRGKHVPWSQLTVIDQIALPQAYPNAAKNAAAIDISVDRLQASSLTDSTCTTYSSAMMTPSFDTTTERSECRTALTSFADDLRLDSKDESTLRHDTTQTPPSSSWYGTQASFPVSDLESFGPAADKTTSVSEAKRQILSSDATCMERQVKAPKLRQQDFCVEAGAAGCDCKASDAVTRTDSVDFGQGFSCVPLIHRDFEVEVEATRLSKAYPDCAHQLACLQYPQDIHGFVTARPPTGFQASDPAVWQEAKKPKQKARITLTGAIESKDNASLTQLELLPLRVVNNGCRVTRRYGWDRMLVVVVPLLRNSPGLLKHFANVEGHRTAGGHWLDQELELCGRVWRAFYVKDKDRIDKSGTYKESANSSADEERASKVYFFAVRGRGINAVPFEDFFDWHLNSNKNQHQPICKLYSRWSLAVSDTVATIEFEPKQVHPIEDIVANGELGDDSFDKKGLHSGADQVHTADQNQIMTDGCGVISVGAAKLVLQKYLASGERPSVFQARCNGAKGMFAISAHYDTNDEGHREPWIKIRGSQQKIAVRDTDWKDGTCEEGRWTLDVVGVSHPPKIAKLSRELLPILEAGGVSREALRNVLEEGFTPQIEESMNSINDRQALACWIEEQPALPPSVAARVSSMLRYGFDPRSNNRLAHDVRLTLEHWLRKIHVDFNISIPQSTKLYGVADSEGVLKPGEVHLVLSEPVKDGRTDKSWNISHGTKAIISRTPCLMAWDAQAVTVVQKPELMHLKDVLVMSVRGKMPLAAKLQGGDYDGDTFLVCWDPRIAGPFLNTPVMKPAPIGAYGIKKVQTTLRDITRGKKLTLAHVSRFYHSIWPLVLSDNVLGQLANYINQYIYNFPKLASEEVYALGHLHGHIIDSEKQGYVYGFTQLRLWLRQQKFPLADKLTIPPYMENKGRNKSGEHNTSCFEQNPATRTRSKHPDLSKMVASKPTEKRGKHILDYVEDMVINPVIRGGLETMNCLLRDANYDRDPVLHGPLHDAQARVQGNVELKEVVMTEEDHVRKEVARISKMWAILNDKYHIRGGDFEQSCVDPCREQYERIQPLNPNHPFVMSWMLGTPSFWDQLKASILYKHFKSKWKFVFYVAMNTLGHIKAASGGGAMVDSRIAEVSKPRRRRIQRRTRSGAAEAALQDNPAEQTESDMFDDGIEDHDFLDYMETE